jgi:hypothetical protein
VAAPHQGRAQEAGLRERPLEEALRGVARDVEAERAEPRALAVDQRRRAELLGEPTELAARGRALVEIYEVDGDPPLGEETLRLAGVLAVGEAEDLDVYCSGVREAGIYRGWPERDAGGFICRGVREAGIYRGWPERDAARLRNSCQTLIGIGGVPGAFAFPIAGP